MFSYRLILKRAINISLRHKYLWLFGLFAIFLLGSGQYNLAFGLVNEELEGNFFFGFANVFNSGASINNALANFGQSFTADPLLTSVVMVFLLIALVLVLVLAWFAIVSQIALINNSALILKKDKKTTIREGVSAGVVNFWPVLGINLIGKGLICFLAAFIGLPLFFVASGKLALISFLYIFLFIVFLPFALIISFMMKYAAAYVIIKKEKFMSAITLSWQLFIKNWLTSIEIAVVLFLTEALVIIVASLAALIIAVPYIFFAQILAMILATVFPSLVLFNFLLALGLVLLTIFVVLLGSALMVFKMSAWTDIFIELDGRKKTLSKLIRLFAK